MGSQWTHAIFHKANLGEDKFYAFHLRPDDATRESYVVMEEGGVVCYMNDQDEVGTGCRIIFVSRTDGERLIARINAEGKKLELEMKPRLERWARIFGNSVAQALRLK